MSDLLLHCASVSRGKKGKVHYPQFFRLIKPQSVQLHLCRLRLIWQGSSPAVMGSGGPGGLAVKVLLSVYAGYKLAGGVKIKPAVAGRH